MLPPILLTLASTALIFAVLAIWQSLRAAFGAADPASFMSLGADVARESLQDEKAALIRGLQDLKFEFQSGKLSEADYKEQEVVLRTRTREVMRLLDVDLEPFREKAEAMLRPKTKGKAKAPYRKAAVEARETASVICVSCGTKNDEDARFCKGCGGAVGPDTDARPSEGEATPKSVLEGEEAERVSQPNDEDSDQAPEDSVNPKESL
jgi:ribosomal protein L40E